MAAFVLHTVLKTATIFLKEVVVVVVQISASDRFFISKLVQVIMGEGRF